MINVGVDVGSKYVKVAISRGFENLAFAEEAIHRNVNKSISRAVKKALNTVDIGFFEKKHYYFTGDVYHIPHKYKKKSRAVCLNKYYSINAPDKDKLVIDAGNINIEAYILSRKNKVLDSYKNDRCSAGCGRFLEIACKILGIGITDIDAIVSSSTKPVDISSGCIVFAESDIITLVNSGVEISDILHGVIILIAGKIATMFDRYEHNFEGDVYLTGGLARIKSLISEIEPLIEKKVLVTGIDPMFNAAVGASMLGCNE